MPVIDSYQKIIFVTKKNHFINFGITTQNRITFPRFYRIPVLDE